MFYVYVEGRGYNCKFNTPKKLKKGMFTLDRAWAQPFAERRFAQTTVDVLAQAGIIATIVEA